MKDILAELEKPGRDPRPDFRTASFKDGVEHIGDLTPGMQLEGVVTNVANFGAFVDIGVHQDGLVHVSQLADRFVKDPRDVVKAGDIVTVKVVDDRPEAPAHRADDEAEGNGSAHAPRSGANETEPLAKRSHNDGVLGGLRRSFASVTRPGAPA